MVLMSHNEPLHNHNTHHMCLPAFHSLCFPFTSTSTNGVHVMVSPMVYLAIQPMSCAIHLSLQHNHIITLASHHNRHTHHVGSVITPNAKHPDTAIVKATQQMHTHKDKADVHSMLGVVPVVVPMVVWIAWLACVDVVFCVIFHTRPSIVASDVCRCVPHPNHHQTLGCAVGQSCIHFASCQSPTTPCLSPCHTSPSCFFHNCSSFFSMSSSPSSFCDH